MRRVSIFLILLSVCMLLAACTVPEAKQPTEMPVPTDAVRLVALNVGKADCLLLELNDKRYLIDTGSVQSWGRVRTALSLRGATALDGVFLTHTDKDHGGGMADLAASDITVGAWYAPRVFHDKKPAKHQAVLAAQARGDEVIWLDAGKAFTVDERFTFEILGPQSADASDENNNSLVLRVVTPQGNLLFMGDALFAAERALLSSGYALSADVLKTGHHGRDDATSVSFINAVRPKVAVISTSTVERPDSPALSVTAALKNIACDVVVTQDTAIGWELTLVGGTPSLQALVDPHPRTEGVVFGSPDFLGDRFTVENRSGEDVSLSGWSLFAWEDDVRMDFSANDILPAGGQKTVAGRGADMPSDYTWPDKRILKENKADQLTLYDAFGREVDTIQWGGA